MQRQAARGSSISPLQRLSSSVLSTKQVRAVDQIAVARFGMHSLVLMENAALGCVNWIRARFANPIKTIVLCGQGNNGGDGLAITRHLRCHGWDCQAYMPGPIEKFSTDAAHQASILQAGNGRGLKVVSPAESSPVVDSVGSAQLIIDAMLGTGASGNPRSPIADWIRAANASTAFRLAIDIPTGVNADSGQLSDPTFQADATLTFVALKPSMQNRQASHIFGQITVLPIGIPEQLIEELLHEKL